MTIRAIVFIVPLVLSFLAAVALSEWLPGFEPFWQRVVRWVAIAIVATVVLIFAESMLRRLLPLAALLSLTLVFPDETPSRFGIALRGMSARQLAKRLDEVEEQGLGDTPREAANTLLSLVGALSRHDRLTRGHSERVRAYSQLIGEEMELDAPQLDGLRWAGLLHDVGKMAVPEEILNKPGTLTDEEFAVVKTHPAHGRAMVAPLADWLGDSSRAVYEHHERWTGGGYPTGVTGEDLALESRIVSVADAFDVMTSSRSYKKAIPLRDARAELQRCAGSQFDPAVVRAMLNISLGKMWRVMGPLSWAAQLGLFPRTLAASAPAANATVAAAVAALITAVSAAIPGLPSADDGPVDRAAVVDSTTTLPRADDSRRGSRVTDDRSRGGTGPTTTAVGAQPPTLGGPVTSLATSTPSTTSSTPSTTSTTSTASTTSTTSRTITLPPPTTATATSSLAPVIDPTLPPGATTVAPTPPPSTSPPTTEPRPTTTPPPTVGTTTTTMPVAGSLSLTSPSAGDQVSQPVLDLVPAAAPQNPGPVPNYDTDRNDDPGLTIRPTPQGLTTTEPDGVQAWRFPATITELQGSATLELFVAAADTAGPGQLIVRAGVFDCDAAREACLRLVHDTVAGRAEAGAFVPFAFDLTIPATSLAAGHRFELRVAAISGSTSDLWIAYDSADAPSTLMIDAP